MMNSTVPVLFVSVDEVDGKCIVCLVKFDNMLNR